MSKFIEKFKSLLTEENNDVTAKRCWSKIDSAFASKLAILEADRLDLEYKVLEYKESLERAKLNFGNTEVNRETYLNTIINAKNNLIQAEDDLKELEETIKFLNITHEELR